MNAKDLSMQLAGRAPDVAEYLIPQGKRKGQEWKAGNTSGEPGDSLSVRITGAKAGVWKDFASGEGGDLIDLWMACRGMSMSEALKEVKQYLGVRDESPKPPEKVYRRPESPRAPAPRARVAEWLKGRGLSDETIKAFKIAEQQHAGRTYAVFPFIDEHGELINIKYRNPDEKKDMRQEAGAAPCLFGWHLIDPKARTVTISIDQIFNLITIEVRGGSTGKPDRLQEQDRWTKLLPVIKEAVTTVADLREKGNEPLAQSVIELTRETLRRFDERLDIDEFLPKQSKDPQNPENLQRELMKAKAQIEALTQENKDMANAAQKGIYQVAASIATSANPPVSAQAFVIALQALENQDAPQPMAPPDMPEMPPQEPQELIDPTATAAGPTLQ